MAALSPGTKLGQYEVIEAIGAGGIGEVYRARDGKLGRDVAVKVLPEEFARDRERLDRFEREARLLAQVNHKNIATLYGLEGHDGQKFIVMELVEGETLAERIAKGPVPIDEAIKLFIQIAEGLEAADEKNIIHRDLKPANIKIGPDGNPKILDFGLAKAFAGEGLSAGDSSQSPTLTRGTAVGTIMGTAAYMSPEQAKGKTLDRRTDNWAFGCCLYEALTGRRVFAREDITETLASVLRDEPRWDALPASTPSAVTKLLHRCLERDRNLRLQHIGDARIELLESPHAEPIHRSSAGLRQIAAVALIASALTSVAAWLMTRSSETTMGAAVQRLSVGIPDGDRFGSGGSSSLALSPSGDALVYVASRDGVQQLFHRPFERDEPIPLSGTDGAKQPFFSPDGSSVGFFANSQLKTISLDTGRVTTLCAATPEPTGGSWASDGRVFFSPGRTSGVFQVAATGGEPSPVTLSAQDEGAVQHFPTLIPGTDVLLYREELDGDRLIVVQNLATGARSVVISGASSRVPVYLTSGHVLVSRAPTSIWAAPLDVDKLVLTSELVPVLQDVSLAMHVFAEMAVSENGTLVYLPDSENDPVDTVPIWVDREGRAEDVAEVPAERFMNPRLSPDGETLLLSSFGSPTLGVWMLDIQRGALSRLVEGGTRGFFSRDGKTVVFGSARGFGFNIYTRPADGSGSETQITFEGQGVPYSMSPDGESILLRAQGEGGDRDVMLAALNGSEPELLLGTTYSEHSAMISPDGQFVAYVSDESGQDEVYVRPFPDLGQVIHISVDGGTEPLWRRDGGELFYRSELHLMSVAITTKPSFEAGKPVPLFEDKHVRQTSRPWTNYDVDRDGSRFVMLRQRGESAGPRELRVVLNWFAELERLVPTSQ